MIWYSEEKIQEYFKEMDLDVRRSNNARWIDQKCTPDVLCIVADCIENYITTNNVDEFTSVDIWRDRYTSEFVQSIFCKPDLDLKESKNEYDKFFQQPIELLTYAKIILKIKRGTRNFYTLQEPQLLSFIAFRERNALIFLQVYISKVLSDSGLKPLFEDFFLKQTNDSYIALKSGYEEFTILNTPINKVVECRRIFTKILNPIAFGKSKLGTERGRISNHPITYDMLMYNRDNFRDINTEKPKGVTRAGFLKTNSSRVNQQYYRYSSFKAKRKLKNYIDTFTSGETEVKVGLGLEGIASHIHHIFPESQYPEISGFIENLIALTPTQHLNLAHPKGNTQLVDKDYQFLCILAKCDTIEQNICNENAIRIYSFENYQYILNVGLSTTEFSDIEMNDFDTIREKIINRAKPI